MDLRHLRYFVGMVEAGSLVKASERLHVAQPALSVHLSNLEVELGTQLVIRSNRGIVTTEDGALLYERAVVMLRYHQEALNALKARKTKPKGLVSLGVPSTLPGMIAPHIYRMLSEELPDVQLYMADASTAVIYEWLHEGKIDLAILFSLPENSGIELTPLYMEEFCLVGKAYEGDEAGEIDFANIFDFPLVMPCKSTVWRKVLDDAAAKHGKILRSPIETESLSALRAMALSGDCYALLPRSSVHADVVSGKLMARRIVNPDLRGMMSVANLNGRELPRAAREVRDIVVRACHLATESLRPLTAGSEATPIMRVTPTNLFPIHPPSPARGAVRH